MPNGVKCQGDQVLSSSSSQPIETSGLINSKTEIKAKLKQRSPCCEQPEEGAMGTT